MNKGKDIIYTNKETNEELYGTIDTVVYKNGKIIGYDITNCNNPYDLYIDEFIPLYKFNIKEFKRS